MPALGQLLLFLSMGESSWCDESLANAEAARAVVMWVNSSVLEDDFYFLWRWVTILIIYTLIEQTHKGGRTRIQVQTSKYLVLSLRRTTQSRISTAPYLPLSPVPSFYSLQRCPPPHPITLPPSPSLNLQIISSAKQTLTLLLLLLLHPPVK